MVISRGKLKKLRENFIPSRISHAVGPEAVVGHKLTWLPVYLTMLLAEVM
jgi:hypothetical protein